MSRPRPPLLAVPAELAGRRVFRFVARAEGRRRTGLLRADHREAALAELGRRRWIPLHLEEVRAGELRPRRSLAGPGEAGLLLGRLAVLLRSGVPMAAALRVLRSESPESLPRVARIEADVRTGHPLSQALARSGLVPSWCAAAVAAAEQAGDLAGALERAAGTLERSEAFRRRVAGALTYPATVLALALLLNAVLVRTMLPAFRRAFQEGALHVPAFSRVVLDAAWLAGDLRVWAALGLAALAFRMLLPEPALQHLLDRLPGYGALRRRAADASFLRDLAFLLQAGVPLQRGLALLQQVTWSSGLAARIGRVRTQVVNQGAPLSVAFADHGFGSMARDLTAAAEESGDYAGMLRRLADSRAAEVDLALSSWSALLEPGLVVLVGAGIGVVVVALLLPLYANASTW